MAEWWKGMWAVAQDFSDEQLRAALELLAEVRSDVLNELQQPEIGLGDPPQGDPPMAARIWRDAATGAWWIAFATDALAVYAGVSSAADLIGLRVGEVTGHPAPLRQLQLALEVLAEKRPYATSVAWLRDRQTREKRWFFQRWTRVDESTLQVDLWPTPPADYDDDDPADADADADAADPVVADFTQDGEGVWRVSSLSANGPALGGAAVNEVIGRSFTEIAQMFLIAYGQRERLTLGPPALARMDSWPMSWLRDRRTGEKKWFRQQWERIDEHTVRVHAWRVPVPDESSTEEIYAPDEVVRVTWTTDINGNFVAVNEVFCAVMGYLRDELLHTGATQILRPHTPRDDPEITEIIQAMRRLRHRQSQQEHIHMSWMESRSGRRIELPHAVMTFRRVHDMELWDVVAEVSAAYLVPEPPVC